MYGKNNTNYNMILIKFYKIHALSKCLLKLKTGALTRLVITNHVVYYI